MEFQASSISRSRYLALCCCIGVLMAVCTAGCHRTPSSFPTARLALEAARWEGESTEVPFECVGGYVLLKVRVQQANYWMMLDTGSVCTMVSPELLAAAKISPGSDRLETVDMGGTKLSMPVATIPGVTIGSMQTPPFVTGVRDLSIVSDGAGRKVDMVGGLPLFGQLLLTVDYPARKIRLTRGALPEPDGKEVLPLQRAAGRRYLMPVTVAGCEVWAAPDTGCMAGLVCPSWAETLFPKAREVPRNEKMRFWGGDGDAGILAVPGECRVGSTTAANPVIVLAGQADPVVGYELMDSFQVTIDQVHQRIRFRKTRPEPLQLPGPLTTGIAVASTGHITAILPGSGAAKAGLRTGDRIRMVNGTPYSPKMAYGVLPRTLNEKLNLIVDRNGQQLRIGLTMTPLAQVEPKR